MDSFSRMTILELQKTIEFIYKLTGIHIETNRQSMVEGRVQKRMRQLKIFDYLTYLKCVEENEKEKLLFIDLVTTNETYFFRTPRIWDYIEKIFLPNWYQANKGKVFYVWSAAASSGDEAHSLGLLLQAFKDAHARFQYKIMGTDISEKMIEECKRGQYKGRTIDTLQKTKPEWMKTYMIKTDDHYVIHPTIKQNMEFKRHNLFTSLPTTNHFDLVLLRNVLIYFTSRDQEKVLQAIYPKVNKDGLLIIGESESLMHIQTNFEQIEPLLYKPKKAKTEAA